MAWLKRSGERITQHNRLIDERALQRGRGSVPSDVVSRMTGPITYAVIASVITASLTVML